MPAACGDLIAVVAHDLLNPLTAILLSTGRLEAAVANSGCAPETLLPGLETVRRAGKRMERLLGDLLNLSRLERGVFGLELRDESVALVLLAAADEAFPGASANAIELRTQPATGSVLCDRDRLMQVFGNLTANACRFVAPGGVITMGAVIEREHARFFVQDTGCGIDPAALPYVFDAFWQGRDGHRRGVGLGLTVAKAIVEAHGGRIWVESEPACGTTFQFTVPVSR